MEVLMSSNISGGAPEAYIPGQFQLDLPSEMGAAAGDVVKFGSFDGTEDAEVTHWSSDTSADGSEETTVSHYSVARQPNESQKHFEERVYAGVNPNDATFITDGSLTSSSGNLDPAMLAQMVSQYGIEAV
jgi:hypothetical protein